MDLRGYDLDGSAF